MMFSKLSHRTNLPYTPAGRLCNKLQGYTGTGNIYAYSPNNKQHAIRRIYNGITNELSNLRWDNNGNLAQQTVYSVNNNVPTFLNMRMLFWNEDDRLNLVAGDGYLSYYAYGYDGNRAIKMTGSAAIDQTGTLLNSTNLENITIYPNEYLAVTQAEYTKYYYAGGNRIASKIGTGGFEKMASLCTEDLNLSANANTLFGNALQQIVNITNQPNDEFPVNVCGGYNVATELLADPLPDFYISQTNLNFTQNNLLQQFRQNLTNSVEPVYYFHSDHLGSASWISDGTGGAVQHLQYLPFGEHFVNEQSSGYFERFTFTGKEKDIETGYYYFGARFDNVDLGFISVDPMSDKYPSISPYAYCAWNPIKLVDPEGNFPVKIHRKIVKGALGTNKIGLIAKSGLLYGTGVYSDWFHPSNSSYHMDNMKGTESIKTLYNKHRESFSDHMDEGKYVDAGADLHAIADFYSHSNYVDLYQQYEESRGNSVSAGDVKPFSEMMGNQDFMDFVEGQGGLKTGTFSVKSWAAEKCFGKAPEPGSHSLINLDKPDSPHGMESFGSGGTRHDAARAAAEKEINKLIEAKLPQ